jgi:lantibiotic modifying enzyme
MSGTAQRRLAAAARIGDQLVAAAHWDESRARANWLSHVDRQGDIPGQLQPGVAALEADLYRGSTGVALFLGELAGLTGQSDAWKTALGGLRRSARQFLEHPPERASSVSAHLGHLGTARVLARLRQLAGHGAGHPWPDDLDSLTERLLERVAAELGEPSRRRSLDWLGGEAGAISTLLALGRVDLAGRAAQTLHRVAEADGGLWSGGSLGGPETAQGDQPAPPALSGLAHGLAGPFLGLLELAAAVDGDEPDAAERHRRLAHRALEAEDALYVPERGNWRDPRPGMEAQEHVAWCHGAPGIAVARARAVALDPSRADDHRAKARAGLATAERALDQGLAGGRRDVTLCHGLLGLAELLELGGELLGETPDDGLRARARAATDELVSRHGASGDWPSGMPGGRPSPALFLGSAGVGHHLLRLAAPGAVPPVLVGVPGW